MMNFEERVNEALEKTEVMEDTFHANGLTILSYNIEYISDNIITYIFEIASDREGILNNVYVNINCYNDQRRIMCNAKEYISKASFEGYGVIRITASRNDLSQEVQHIRVYCTKN